MAVAISFKNGKCLEAIDYYRQVFSLDSPKYILKYKDFEKYNYPPDIRDRVYNSYIEVYGNRIYLYDATNDKAMIEGNNVRIVIETSSDNLFDAYNKLRKDSRVISEPQKVNKKLFTSLIDKYGIIRQFVART